MVEMHTCPRRLFEFGPWKRAENLDQWLSRRGTLTCSFCGSVAPDDFLRQAAAGVLVGPTDKDYKAYIGAGKFYFMHLSADQQLEFLALHNTRRMRIGEPGYFYVVPYFARPNS